MGINIVETGENIRVKRLLYRSIHRGCKEMDFVLGRFAEQHLHNFNESELDHYEKFIEENDWDLYAWLVGQSEMPECHKNNVVNLLLNFL